MKTDHTPGPWLLADTDKTFVYALGSDGFNRFFAHVQDARTPAHELAANARLIATAPDLLEALKNLDEAYCRAGSSLTRDERHEDRLRLIAARSAIEKATGTTP